MAFPADYTLLGDLEVPTITGTHTDYVALITYNDFTTAMLSQLDNGGGDLRISDDQSGATQLPIDVVEFDKVGNSVQVWVKIPSAFTGKKIYVWGNNTGDMQPTVTDSYGRNAVYSSSYYRGLQGGSIDDASGNTSVSVESGSVGTRVGINGTAIDLDGATNLNLNSVPSNIGDYSVSVWVRRDSNTEGSVYGTDKQAGDELKIGLRYDSSGFATGTTNVFKVSSNTVSQETIPSNTYPINQWLHTVLTRQGSTSKFYINGIERASWNTGSATFTPSNFFIGTGVKAPNKLNGGVQTLDWNSQSKSADLALTEYQNQSANGWFIPSDNTGTAPETHSFSCVVNLNLHIGFVNKKATNQSSSISNNLSLSEASTKVSKQSSSLDLSIGNQSNFIKGSELSSESGVLLSKSFIAVKESNIESKVFTSRSDLGVSASGAINKGSNLSSLIDLDILEDVTVIKTAKQASELSLEKEEEFKSIKLISINSVLDLGVGKNLVTAKISSQSSSQSFNLYSIGSALGENIELNKFSFKVVGDISTPTIVGDISIRFD